MKIQVFRFEHPHPLLHEIRVIQSDHTADPLTHVVPPLGHPEIVFYLGKKNQIKNTTCKNGFITGQYKTVQKLDFIPGYHFISISLHPYGLRQLFNVKASELIDAIVDVEEHPATKRLLEYIQNSKTIDGAFVKQFNQLPTYPISDSRASIFARETNKHT